MEELGRGIVLEPLAQSLIAGGVLSATPTPPKAAWLPKIAAGEAWWCWPTRSALPATASIRRQSHRPRAAGT